MINTLLLSIGAALSLGWGIAHLFPTRNVVKGFGDLSADNKNILTMEWVIEGVTLMFIGVLVAVLMFADLTAWISRLVFLLVSFFLVALAIISFFTGFKVNFLPYKLCPFIFLTSAILIMLGGVFLQQEQSPEEALIGFKKEVIEAEKAFGRMAKENGVKEAFLAVPAADRSDRCEKFINT
jgi:hypothetical protein